MAKQSPFVEHVLDLLVPLGPVRARGMFGGWGIYLDDLMFALIAWERLFIKVDEASKPRFAGAGAEPFVYDGRNGPIEMSYWEAPDGSLDSPDDLLPWAELGVAAARRAYAKKKPKKKALKRRG